MTVSKNHAGLYLIALLAVTLLMPSEGAGKWGKKDKGGSEPVEVKSKNSFAETVAKFKDTVVNNQMMIMFEADHQKMLSMISVESKPSETILFGKPQMGQTVLSAEPRAALEMPMRVNIREMDNGEVVLIYYKPSYLFSHYKNPKLTDLGNTMDQMIGMLVGAASK